MIYSRAMKEAVDILRNLLVGKEVLAIVRDQQFVMRCQQDKIKRMELAAERMRLTLLVQWRISIEKPEEDVRDHLDAAIDDTFDQVARLEEHIA